MKTKLAHYSLLVILACSLFGFYSCEEEKDDFFVFEYDDVYFETPISGVNISITSSTRLGIIGGVAPYSVQIADEQVAKASLDNEKNDISISSIKLGTTSLTLKDSEGRTLKIGVQVVNGRQSFHVKVIEARIEGIELEDNALTELEGKVAVESLMRTTGVIGFSFNTKESGNVSIIPSKNDIQYNGTFERTLTEEGTIFNVNIKGKAHKLRFQYPEKPEIPEEEKVISRALGPIDCWFIEDVTENYKKDYPHATSLKVECAYYGSLSR